MSAPTDVYWGGSLSCLYQRDEPVFIKHKASSAVTSVDHAAFAATARVLGLRHILPLFFSYVTYCCTEGIRITGTVAILSITYGLQLLLILLLLVQEFDGTVWHLTWHLLRSVFAAYTVRKIRNDPSSAAVKSSQA